MTMIKELKNLSWELNVMYVEDDELIRQQMITLLSKFFNQVWIAENGEKGLLLYEQHGEEIDIIFSDISMPRMNGLDMVTQIKTVNPQQKIIIISAHSDQENLLQSIELGIDQFLVKPVSAQQFVSKITKVVTGLKEGRESNIAKSVSLDDLTGLPNRTQLYRDLEEGKEATLILLAINNYHQLSDTYGYENTDYFIAKIASRMTELKTSPNLISIYRYNMDQLMIVCHRVVDPKTLQIQLNEMLHQLEQENVYIKGFSFPLSAQLTVGVAFKLALGTWVEAVQQAEVILNNAKTEGEKLVIYDQSLKIVDKVKENIVWSEKISRAIEHSRIILFYQPIFDNHRKIITKYECLVRLQEEDGTVHSPYHFLEISKKTTMYRQITLLVIQQALKKMEETGLEISINLSIDNLLDEEIRTVLLKELSINQDLANQLIVEVLESDGIENYEEINLFLKEIKTFGARIAIDDFGTGYSNFAHLIKLDVDFVKIDGSLIKNIHTDVHAQVIVRSIVDFSKKLSIKTVAEFVDNEAVFQTLNRIGVDYSQGFYLGEPTAQLKG